MTPEIQEAEGRVKATREAEAREHVRCDEAIAVAEASKKRATELRIEAENSLEALLDAQIAALEARRIKARDGGEGDAPFEPIGSVFGGERTTASWLRDVAEQGRVALGAAE